MNNHGYIRQDFHIHTPVSFCGQMPHLSAHQIYLLTKEAKTFDDIIEQCIVCVIPRIVRQVEKMRLAHFGFSDHLYAGEHSNPNFAERRQQAIKDWNRMRKELRKTETSAKWYIGVECDPLEGGQVGVTEEERKHLDYVIVGAFQWGERYIQDRFGKDRHAALAFAKQEILAVMENPLIDGLAHCYPLGKGFGQFDTSLIDDDFAREIGDKAKTTGTALEISSRFDFSEGSHYGRMVKQWVDSGCLFYFGSDAHVLENIGHNLNEALAMMEKAGVAPNRLWLPDDKRRIPLRGEEP
jgi:histidinol phosphatase-like PHP family hydrolase